MTNVRPGVFGAVFGGGFLLFTILLIITNGPLAWVAITAVGLVTLAALVLWLRAEPTEAPVVFQARVDEPVPEPVAVTTEEAPADASDRYYDYRGDVHDVIDVEGIGPVYAERLNAAGVQTTARLCFIGAEEAARIADVPVKTAEKWIAMAQLAKVNGIGKQYAEALVRGGVMTIERLKKGSPDRIAAEVTRYLEGLDNNVLGQKVTARRVQGWQKKAASMRRVRTPVPTN